MSLLDLVRAAAGMRIVDEDGEEDTLQLLPPATGAEIAALAATLPCPLPPHVRELLALTRGFENGPLESFEFAGVAGGFGMTEIFPHALSLAHDGYGNDWCADLQADSSDWAPIYFACHDPPVIAFQCATLEHFVAELIRFANPPHESEIDFVHEQATNTLWRSNPGTIKVSDARSAQDATLAAFARELDDTYLIVDLRHAKMGDGFSWGRYGPKTKIVRHGREPLFAYQVKSRLERWLGR